MRVRIIVLVTAVLLFSAIIAVPRIIEASKSSPGDNAQLDSSVANPFQGKKQDITVGESIRNDTSIPVREMKQQPVFKPKKEANANPKVAHFHKDANDPVVQKQLGETELSLPNMPGTSQNFNGIAFPGVACNC